MKFVVYSHAKKAEDEHIVEINTIEELIELYEEARKASEGDREHFCYGLEIGVNTSDYFGFDEAKYEIEILNDEDE